MSFEKDKYLNWEKGVHPTQIFITGNAFYKPCFCCGQNISNLEKVFHEKEQELATRISEQEKKLSEQTKKISELETKIQEQAKKISEQETTSKIQLEQLQYPLSLIHRFFDSSVYGILVLDKEKKAIQFNSKFKSMWNLTEKFMRENQLSNIVQFIAKQLDNPQCFLENINKNFEPHTVTILNLKCGKFYEHYSQNYRIDKESLETIIWSFHDITKRIVHEKNLQYKATHDILTDLPNRVFLMDQINQTIALAAISKKKIALLFVDLDGFKMVNDSLGHQAGDEVLKTITQRLKKGLRGTDIFGRLGGDEFVIILPELETSENASENAIQVAKFLNSLMKEPLNISNREIVLTASIGIAIYDKHGKSSHDLLKRADFAMYRAKELGGSQYQLYSEKLNKGTF